MFYPSKVDQMSILDQNFKKRGAWQVFNFERGSLKNFGRSMKNPTFKGGGEGGSSQKTDIEVGLPKKGGLDSLQI